MLCYALYHTHITLGREHVCAAHKCNVAGVAWHWCRLHTGTGMLRRKWQLARTMYAASVSSGSEHGDPLHAQVLHVTVSADRCRHLRAWRQGTMEMSRERTCAR